MSFSKFRIMGNAIFNDEFPVNIGFGYNYGGDNWVRSDLKSLYLKELERGYNGNDSYWQLSIDDKVIFKDYSKDMIKYISEFIRDKKIEDILDV